MNYLAHLCLSLDDPYIMLGNFIADDISITETKSLDIEFMRGIHLHRKIDAFTDAHPSFLQSVELFKPNHGRYASVIVDILHDHFLCHNWVRLMTQSFDHFEQHVYSQFELMLPSLTDGKHKRHVENLVNHRYLYVYQSQEGMLGVMKRMDARTRFDSDFQGAVVEMFENYDLLNANFLQLYTGLTKTLPDLWQSVLESYPSK